MGEGGNVAAREKTSNTSSGDMEVDTTQPLTQKNILPPSQRWDISTGRSSNINDDSTHAGGKRHGEFLEKANNENEMPPDGQLWLPRHDPSYLYRVEWVPPPPAMPIAATYIPQPTATTGAMQNLYWTPRHHDTSFGVDEPPPLAYSNSHWNPSHLQHGWLHPTQARMQPTQTTPTSAGGVRVTNYNAIPRMSQAVAEAMVEMGSERSDFGMNTQTDNEEEEGIPVEDG